MNLKEYQGKKIFDQYDILIPKSVLITEKTSDTSLNYIKTDNCFIKAQILAGKRKKNGGIKECSKKNCVILAKEMIGTSIRGRIVEEVLVEEKVEIDKEYFVSITLDRYSRKYIIILSKEGGVDIEELSKNEPEKIDKIYFESFRISWLNNQIKDKGYPSEIMGIIKKLFNIIIDKDAILTEINPLIMQNNEFIAGDSKIVIDDNSLYRQKDLKKYQYQGLTELESLAKSAKLHYVDLKGDIGVIGNGAGLVMATIDLIAHYGGKAANFLDLRGGTGTETMESALDIITKKDIKGICINIFGGITHCDDIAKGILQFLHDHKIHSYIAVRMIGTREKEGKEILENAGITVHTSMEEAIKILLENCENTEK